MKKLLYICALIFMSSLSAQEINWMTFDEALEAQAKNPKKIIVDAYTTWCGPCKLLDKNTFGDQQVADFINENYYAVKFNAEGTEEVNYLDNVYTNPRHDPNRRGRNSQHEFAQAMKLRGYPSIVFFDEKGNYIQPVVGYKTPRQLEIFLKMIANDDYKDLTTQEKWQAYQDSFKYTFGE
ncbi:thioredoxin fold domain-containing protein [uncultured Dokdonia sp.]|uniref:thioredoxin family protein n=1 Tax=uncultured Dokdonia sp. TaxID=575653 RepID=UPI00262FA671|nr:thioredoxin fold domain-containing protein [uncultured Dokdonia sp.]